MGQTVAIFSLCSSEPRRTIAEMNFFQRWSRRFGLSEGPHERLRRELETAAVKLPFIESAEALPLLEFLFCELPGIVAGHPDEDTALLAEAYAWCCYGLWQCESAFPAFPRELRSVFSLRPQRRAGKAAFRGGFARPDDRGVQRQRWPMRLQPTGAGRRGNHSGIGKHHQARTV